MWKEQFVGLAKYNQKMNQKIFSTSAKLSTADLFKDQAAFFKSVWGTLHHIYGADLIWLRRFQMIPGADLLLTSLEYFPKVTSFEPDLYSNISDLTEDRTKLDQVIIDFFNAFPDFRYEEILNYKNMANDHHENKLWILFTHFFNHQTHHRGQATTLLSQHGLDVGITDFPAVLRERP